MKKNIFIPFLLTMVLSSGFFAQDIKLSAELSYDVKDNGYIEAIIHKDGSSVYIFRKRSKGKGIDYYIQKLNRSTFVEQAFNELKFPTDLGSPVDVVEHIFYKADHYYAYFSTEDSPARYISQFDLQGKCLKTFKLIDKAILPDETARGYKNGQSTLSETVLSPDSNKILIITRHIEASFGEKRYPWYVFDLAAWKPIGKSFNIDFVPDDYFKLRVFLDNQGRVFYTKFAGGADEGAPKYVSVFDPTENEKRDFPIKLDNKQVTDFVFKLQSEEQMEVAGLWKDASAGRGAFYATLDLKTERLSKGFTYKFTPEDSKALFDGLVHKMDGVDGNLTEEDKSYKLFVVDFAHIPGKEDVNVLMELTHSYEIGVTRENSSLAVYYKAAYFCNMGLIRLNSGTGSMVSIPRDLQSLCRIGITSHGKNSSEFVASPNFNFNKGLMYLINREDPILMVVNGRYGGMNITGPSDVAYKNIREGKKTYPKVTTVVYSIKNNKISSSFPLGKTEDFYPQLNSKEDLLVAFKVPYFMNYPYVLPYLDGSDIVLPFYGHKTFVMGRLKVN